MEKTMQKLDITTQQAFEDFCKREFPGKRYKWTPDYCFVQAGTHLKDNLHYEFWNGHLHLHIEGENWRGIRNYLAQKAPFGKMEAHDWGRINCDWMLKKNIHTEKDMFDAFLEIRDIMEHHILNYEATLNVAQVATPQNVIEGLHSEILTVEDLLGKPLFIPHYQRPYRWEEKNVGQLLWDIQINWMTNKSRYRIGSVILHDNGDMLDIVDGQQRITTILLILAACEKSVSRFSLKYNHSSSFLHIESNLKYIKDWLEENIQPNNLYAFTDYLLKKCEFVMIVVKDRSEAFQMFDSQNGRGKELEAYNLLKAYHIRAMEQNSKEEKIKCDQRWEDATQYDATPLIPDDDNIDILKQIFDEQLYRSRRWSRGHAAGKFSKKRIDEFKGFTIDKNHPTIYPYQNPQLLQYLTAKFYHNTLEGTIATSNRFEYGDSDNIDPFVNINQTIVNGKSFFDYIETYVELYKQLFLNLGSFQLSEFKRFYYGYCLNYECNDNKAETERKSPFAHIPKGGATRTGDGYLRELYKSLILVLFDKFGEKGLNKYYKILYRLIYMTRLAYHQVRYRTVDELPLKSLGDCFAILCQAKDLTDLRKLERQMLSNLNNLEIKYDKIENKVTSFIIHGDYGK